MLRVQVWVEDSGFMDFDQLWLPLWPLASDDLAAGIYRGSRTEGLQRRYVEANPHALSNLLVVDIDHNDAELRALSGKAKPTAVVSNRRNGHAHGVWALAEPVTRTEYGSRKATAYAAAVVEGLRRDVDGDKGYSGLMTKNPTHDDWETLWLASSHDASNLWTLDQLKEALGNQMPPQRWRRGRKVVGLGRNCTIFETARTWAYREIRHHFEDPQGLSKSIHSHVHALNNEFSEPLPLSEANGIATSIHRWITTRSNIWRDGAAVYEATFTAIQSARGHKSGIARRSGIQALESAIEEGTLI